MGLAAPPHVGSSRIRDPLCLLHWQVYSSPLSHQGSPNASSSNLKNLKSQGLPGRSGGYDSALPLRGGGGHGFHPWSRKFCMLPGALINRWVPVWMWKPASRPAAGATPRDQCSPGFSGASSGEGIEGLPPASLGRLTPRSREIHPPTGPFPLLV